MTLSASQILNCVDSEIQPIDIPEWPPGAFIKTMTGSERDAWEIYASNQLDKTKDVKRMNTFNIRAKLASLTLCDETGKRLFSDGQVDALGKKSSKALDRVYSAALTLNKLTDDDIKDIEKN